jgi:Tol biopolymer transport system component
VRAAVAGLVGAAFALLSAIAPAPAHAQSSTWVSGNGLLAFTSDHDGTPALFTLDADTSATTSLNTRSGIAELQPAWSPEGDRIVFVRRSGPNRRTDLFVMTAAGRARTRLTSNALPERDPSWSPGGTMLVYAARTSATGDFHVFLAKADGSAREQLTRRDGRAPVFSPDGSKIAFVSDRDGGFPELYVMNANGRNERRLTNNGLIDGNPSWSPDGTHLVFERCCPTGTSDILTIDIATRGETDLTPSGGSQDFDPTWSPDGTRIAYVSFGTVERNIDVWVMNADGTSRTRLTDAAGPDLSPDWQPLPACTIDGTNQADELRGTDGDDVICGHDGDDHVRALAGADLVIGGRGGDLVSGQEGADLLLGQQGNDTLYGGPAYDVIDGGPGRDACGPGADGAFRRVCE